MMTLRLEIEVRRQDGTIRYKEMQKVNSWTKQAAQIFEFMFKHTDGSAFTNTSGTGSKSFDISASQSLPLEMVPDTSTGIFVGTGSTAADKDDHKLETEIADGSASGELTHQAMVAYQGALGTSTGFTTLFERTFQNDSGASITINEVGTESEWDTNTGAGTSIEQFLIVHDVLATGVVVLDSEAVVVRYFTDWDV